MLGRLWVLILVFFSFHAQAYETDQYTTPKTDLADVGEDLSRFIFSNIQAALVEINQDIINLPSKLTALESERDQLRA